MTIEETKSAIQELKARGLNDEAIAASLYEMYKNDKIDFEQFDALVKLVGYELSDEFKAMSDEEKKNQEVGTFGMDESDEEGADENNADENSNEEPKNDASNDEKDEEEKEENPFEKYDSSKNDDDEDDEEKKEAKKMFGF